MVNKYLYGCLFLLFGLTISYSQKVSNVTARQEQSKIIVYYDLETNTPCKITLYVSTNGGTTWQGPLKKVTGNVGTNVTSGNNSVIWNVLDEFEELRGHNIMFQIRSISKYLQTEDDKKMAEDQAKAKQAEEQAAAKKLYDEKIAPVKANKVAYLSNLRGTATTSTTGLAYKSILPGTGVKPTDGSTVYIHYAGYLEDGSLFDSSMAEIAKEYERYDENRAKQNGYQPFPFQYGKKDGLIPGFLEGIGNMSFNERAIFFIPANLAYGEKGAGGVIPPNANIIFEVQLLEGAPAASGPANPEK